LLKLVYGHQTTPKLFYKLKKELFFSQIAKNKNNLNINANHVPVMKNLNEKDNQEWL
jgi:hypothetical protein